LISGLKGGYVMLADEIREYAFREFIEPAQKQGGKRIKIRAGDVHEKMSLRDRMPAVCAALGSEKIEKQYSIKRVRLEGPIHGANTLFTFEI